MVSSRFRHAAVAALAVAVLPLGPSACGSGDAGAKEDAAAGPSARRAAGQDDGEASAGARSTPFGPGCTELPRRGKGSVAAMTGERLATAASHNPELSTLTSAIRRAGLVDTLNNAEGITVFAPTDDAFARLPKAELDGILGDRAKLTRMLNHHVVGEYVGTPKGLQKGSYATLETGTLTIAGRGGTYTVNGSAHVVCGNVRTVNADVQIVDAVLRPPAS